MTYPQLTGRTSLRDIETCLNAHPERLYHMGFRAPIARSTLADANERRDFAIYAEFAHHLIERARTLYQGEELRVDLDNTVHAVDSTTIDLCLALFPWARFRKTKGAVKMHKYAARSAWFDSGVCDALYREAARRKRPRRTAARSPMHSHNGPGLRGLCPAVSYPPATGLLRRAHQAQCAPAPHQLESATARQRRAGRSDRGAPNQGIARDLPRAAASSLLPRRQTRQTAGVPHPRWRRVRCSCR